MTYVSAEEVLALAGVTDTEVPKTTVDLIIDIAEAYVDKFTNTTYWKLLASGTATSGGASTITLSTASFPVDDYYDDYVWIYSGTGVGQVRKIASNTATTITVAEAWDVNPDDTSKFRVCYTGNDPYADLEKYDGNGTDTMYLRRYPIVAVESLTSDGTSISTSTLYLYEHIGKVILGSDSEVSLFKSTSPQLHVFSYYYGVYPLPKMVKSYTMICAALATLQTQMGGTHNIPSTYSLPEGSLTIGQAYINIKGTWDTLMKQKAYYETELVKYVSVA